MKTFKTSHLMDSYSKYGIQFNQKDCFGLQEEMSELAFRQRFGINGGPLLFAARNEKTEEELIQLFRDAFGSKNIFEKKNAQNYLHSVGFFNDSMAVRTEQEIILLNDVLLFRLWNYFAEDIYERSIPNPPSPQEPRVRKEGEQPKIKADGFVPPHYGETWTPTPEMLENSKNGLGLHFSVRDNMTSRIQKFVKDARPDLTYLTQNTFETDEWTNKKLYSYVFDKDTELILDVQSKGQKYLKAILNIPKLVQAAEMLHDITAGAQDGFTHVWIKSLLNDLKED